MGSVAWVTNSIHNYRTTNKKVTSQIASTPSSTWDWGRSPKRMFLMATTTRWACQQRRSWNRAPRALKRTFCSTKLWIRQLERNWLRCPFNIGERKGARWAQFVTRRGCMIWTLLDCLINRCLCKIRWSKTRTLIRKCAQGNLNIRREAKFIRMRHFSQYTRLILTILPVPWLMTQ